MLKEGKDLYRYEEFMKIEKDTKFIRENTLYDWSLFKDEYSYRENYIGCINSLTDECDKLFLSIIRIDSDGMKICTNTW